MMSPSEKEVRDIKRLYLTIGIVCLILMLVGGILIGKFVF